MNLPISKIAFWFPNPYEKEDVAILREKDALKLNRQIKAINEKSWGAFFSRLTRAEVRFVCDWFGVDRKDLGEFDIDNLLESWPQHPQWVSIRWMPASARRLVTVGEGMLDGPYHGFAREQIPQLTTIFQEAGWRLEENTSLTVWR